MYKLHPVPREGMRGKDITTQNFPICCEPMLGQWSDGCFQLHTWPRWHDWPLPKLSSPRRDGSRIRSEKHLETESCTTRVHTSFAFRRHQNRSPIRVTRTDGKKSRHRNATSRLHGPSRSNTTPRSGNTRREGGRGRRKMNPAMIQDEIIKEKIRNKWTIWKNQKRYYPDETLLWERYVKKQLRYFMRQEEAERYKDHRQMENHLYECIYDILRSNNPRQINCLLLNVTEQN